MIITGGTGSRPSRREKTCPSATVHQKSHMD